MDIDTKPIPPIKRDIAEFDGLNEGRSLQEYMAYVKPLIDQYGPEGYKWHRWEVLPIDLWSELDAQVARTAEWAKLKGPTTKVIVDEQLGEEAPSVTEGSTYAIFTGHGRFGIKAANEHFKVDAYNPGGSTLNIALFTNLTEEPKQLSGEDFPTGGTALGEYNSDEGPNIHALAGLPLLDKVNHHCGIDCNNVVVQWTVVYYDEETREEKIGYASYLYTLDQNGSVQFTQTFPEVEENIE